MPARFMSAAKVAGVPEGFTPHSLRHAFASAMLSGASPGPVAEALTRPKLRDQARQYLVELAPGRSSMFAAETS